MSEAGFALYNRAFPIVVELLYALCLSMFLRPFLGDRRWQKAAVVFTLHLAASLIWDRLPMPQGAFTLIVTLLLLIAARLLELKKSLALLLGLLFWNAKISSALTVESLYFMAERLLPQPVSPPEVVYLRSAILLTMLAVSHGIVLGAMLTILVWQLKKRGFTLRPRELCYLCLIPAAGILFGQVISNLLVEVKDGVLLELYERHPAFLAVVPVMALLFYIGSCLTISFQQGMDALQEEREILFVERQQAQAIQERIRQVERFYRQVRELKHEMRGHLTNLKGLASTGEYDSLEDYIAKMDGSISGFELVAQTGNPVTDVIVGDVQQKCQKQGVEFKVDFHYPMSGSYDAFDVGIILQNLLQNAVEACGKVSDGKRFIGLTGKKKGRFFLIEVRNSFAGEVMFGQDGLPVTTKPDAPMHGIGLANVRRETEKYMGEMEVSCGKQVFTVTVMLQNIE